MAFWSWPPRASPSPSREAGTAQALPAYELAARDIHSAQKASPVEDSLTTGERIFGALFQPRATFEDIVRSPTWLVPILVSSASTAGFIFYLIARRGGFDGSASPQWNEAGKAALASAADNLVTFFVFAASLWGVFRGLFHADMEFKTSLGIVAFAEMPFVLSQLLAVLTFFLPGSWAQNASILLHPNLGYFLRGDWPQWVHFFASAASFFAFWWVFLMGLGFALAGRDRVSAGQAVGTVAAFWIASLFLRAWMFKLLPWN